MKEETINSIVREINGQNKAFREQVVMKELKEKGWLFNLYRYFSGKIMPGISKDDFANIYSHTVIFVLLRAALSLPGRSKEYDLKNVLLSITREFPGLNSILIDILKSISGLDLPASLQNFIMESKNKLSGHEPGGIKADDVLSMLYKVLLERYEPVIHKRTRYYPTPGPVVVFMVNSIHQLLKDKLGIDDGLSGLNIRILDPGFGMGNFLAAVMRLAIEEKTKKYGEGMANSFMQSIFFNNINGFEIMLPLYVLGYLHLLEVIKSFVGVQGAVFQKSPLAAGGNLYLTDTLKNGLDIITDHQESSGIGRTNMPVMVILCNPPYSRHSLNKGEGITQLVRDYLQVKDGLIEEKNIKGLQDDYVKFFRFAQWKIDQNGSGIMGFITNNSYLESPTFRGMRYSLLKSFDEIYIINLHGTARKVDKNDDDENIFDVGQGIAIGFFIKRKRTRRVKQVPVDLICKVFYSSMKGSRESKFDRLEKFKAGNYKNVGWERVFPVEKFYLFTPGKQVDIYRQFIKLTDIFPVHSVGIVTARDKLSIKWSEEEMYKTVLDFTRADETVARQDFITGKDTRDWQVKAAQKDIIESGIDRNKIVPILYRPFDIRCTYYTGKSRGFICMPRPGVMRHMLQGNIGLISVRQVSSTTGRFSHVLVTDTIIESRVTSSQNGIAYIFPLDIYVFPGEKNKKNDFNLYDIFPGIKDMPRQPNINTNIYERLHEIFGRNKLPSSRQIFYYIYAILNSSIYRERYRDHLKIDFPRVPFDVKPGLFMKLSGLGEVLVDIHLMKSLDLDYTFSKFEVVGDNLVKKPIFTFTTGGDGRVYINETQYFSDISKEIWEFEVCGYQVLQKWLKERRNRVLSPGEILHYIKICRAIQLTIDYQQQIDRLYSELEKGI